MLLDDAFLALHLLFADLASRAALSLVFDVTLRDNTKCVLRRKRFPVCECFFDLAGSSSYCLSLLARLRDGRASILLSAFTELIDVRDPTAGTSSADDACFARGTPERVAPTIASIASISTM